LYIALESSSHSVLAQFKFYLSSHLLVNMISVKYTMSRIQTAKVVTSAIFLNSAKGSIQPMQQKLLT
jgi:hypothetical protein